MIINYTARKASRSFNFKYHLNDSERRQLIRETSNTACMLYEYYLRMASVDKDIDLDDDQKSADYFGWTKPVAYRWRRELYKQGWIGVVKATGKGIRFAQYYLGKEAVENMPS